MSLASFVPSLLLFLGSSIAVTLAAAIASLITFVMAFFSTGPSKPQGSSNGLGSGKNLGKDPKNIFGIYFFRDLQKSYDDFFFGPWLEFFYSNFRKGPVEKSDLEALTDWAVSYANFILNSLNSLSLDLRALDLEGTLRPAFQAISKFFYTGSTSKASGYRETPVGQLLAQLQAIVHKPLGFATSPSLPGTINSPWWTDFSHLIYWFYFVATFATVAFLWYLYDFRVRRVETAHPIRETRGFSRAQTGDLVTAVLPLTWSATMVMHASTHSINFDENTAGAAFSFTVVAYQWGWNYYFPRDIIALLDAAPKVVGRGRIIRFEIPSVETLQMSQWDSWALRATIGGRHGSRTGRLNTPSALSLVLPTDVPAGIFSPFSIHTSPKVPRWRESLAMALNEISNPPMKPNVAQTGPERSSGHSFTFATPALFRGKPSVHIAGSRIYLTHRHSAPQFMPLSFASASWVTANIYFSEDDDVSTRAERGPLGSFEPSGLPSLENLSGAFKNEIQGTFEAFKAINLDFLRGPSTPSPQHVLWAGADAVTGGGANSLASTEDHGWISPVTARESAQRSSLAVKSSLIAYLQRNSTQAGSAQCPLLLPFDLNARFVLNHPSRSGALPFTWALASTALESEIDSASLGLWVGALLPDLSNSALTQPASLIMRQNTPTSLGSLLSPLTRGLKPFLVNPLGPSFFVPQAMPLSPSPLVAYLYRHSQGGLLSLTPTYCARGPKVLNNGLVLPPLGALPGPRVSLLSYFSKGDALYPAPLCRVRFSPSPAGLGLDEKRLVRLGTSKLVDSTMLSGKLESPATPSLALPSAHLTSLGLGWSTSASLSSYPSYKLSRGGVFRRPFSGLTPQQRPLEGLKEGFKPLSLDKKTSHVGLPLLTLFKPSGLKFHVTPPSLDSQIGAWSPVWACLTPAPTEDLDPIFINSVWTPEVNTTRRSDHNTRYLVSWSPLLSPLTSGSSLNKTLGGPTARASQSPLLLRSSLLALNEIGLKNSFGVRGNRPFFMPSELGGSDNFIFQVPPSSAISPSPLSKGSRWAALWGSLPYPSTNPFVSSATRLTPDNLSGRGASLITSKGLLLRGGVPTLASNHPGSGDRLNPLVDALAALEFSMLGGQDLGSRPKQGYVPINSDISVSRRLRVTKGITLPSDIPMHVICGSKDVIHSWAIPGLNVKIDCIPGYNSHRRLLLRWRGAYWGQCMEVCGRYHHWMPIMVNVSHPALFVDWCLTFLRGLDSQTSNGPSTLPPLNLEALLKPFLPTKS